MNLNQCTLTSDEKGEQLCMKYYDAQGRQFKNLPTGPKYQYLKSLIGFYCVKNFNLLDEKMIRLTTIMNGCLHLLSWLYVAGLDVKISREITWWLWLHSECQQIPTMSESIHLNNAKI